MPIGLDFAALTRIDVIVALDMEILDLLANIFSLSFYEFIGKVLSLAFAKELAMIGSLCNHFGK